MGCGASKKDVVETGAPKSPPPEKHAEKAAVAPLEAPKPATVPDEKHNHQDSPAPQQQPPAANPPPPAATTTTQPAEQPKEEPKPAAEPQPPAAQPNEPPKENKQEKPSSPPPSQPTQPDNATSNDKPPVQPAASPSPAQPNPNAEHKKPAEDHANGKGEKQYFDEKDKEKDNKDNKDNKDKEGKPKTDFHLPAIHPPGTPKRGMLVDIDLGGSGSVPPSPSGKSAVQERFEKYAEERKGNIRPSSASLDRRMADADSRRKQQADQKVKKAKYTNELAKDKYSELREAEEKKTQELMQLIKNKTAQATTKKNAIEQEVKAKAEADVTKARELSAKRREGGSTPQTPHSEGTSPPDSARSAEEDKKATLEPLPPLK